MIKRGVFRYRLGTYFVLFTKTLAFSSFIDICLDPDKNRVPKPSDAFRSFQNISFQCGATATVHCNL